MASGIGAKAQTDSPAPTPTTSITTQTGESTPATNGIPPAELMAHTGGTTGSELTDPRFIFDGTRLVELTAQGHSELETSRELVGVPDGVTEIGADVFAELGLTKVELPESVEIVGDRAFYANEITELVAPGMKSARNGAFQKNRLTKLEHDRLVDIGTSAFADNQLTEIKLTASSDPALTVLAGDAFRDNQLTTVQLPLSLTEIGAGAFANNKLTNFDFHDGLTVIGDQAFSGNQFTTASFPTSITDFGQEVFANNGRWVQIPAGPSLIGNEAYPSGFGHVVDAVSIKINYVDQAGNEIRSPQILASEFTEPNGVYLAGVENRIDAPRLQGYEPLTDPLVFTPDADRFEVTARYRKVDFSPRITGRLNKTLAFGADASTPVLLAGVTATDHRGRPLEVTVSPDSVDTSVQGSSTDVFYTATDSEGRSTTVKGTVLVGANWPEMVICPGWQVKDYTYRGNQITGLSQTGKAKLTANGNRLECWPKVNDRGESVDTIGERAFSGYQSSEYQLTSLPESWGNITTLNYAAFEYNKLTTLPESWGNITNLGMCAFVYNELTTLPESWGNITEIPVGTFELNYLTTLPASWGNITSINDRSFGANQLTTLPESWGNITKLDGAFPGNQLTSLPDSWGNITEIGADTFVNNRLTSLPESWGNITTIGQSAFKTNQLTTLPQSWGNIAEVRNRAFLDNQLTALPASWGNITTVDKWTFQSNKIAVLPESWGNITTIGQGAFSNNQLTSLPESWENVTIIGINSFARNQLTSLPESWGNVTAVHNNAFWNNQLTALPESWGNISIILDGVFSANRLTSLPASWGNITYIGGDAFQNNRLTSLPESWGNVTTIKYWAFQNNRLASLPASWGNVTTIGGNAFSSNRLTALPESWGEITEIGESAFAYNQLTALPESWGKVTTAGSIAFNVNRFDRQGLFFVVADDQLARTVEMLSTGRYGGPLPVHAFLRPVSGTNPDNVASARRVTILVDTNVTVEYVDNAGNPLKPTQTLTLDSRDGNTREFTAPAIVGYRAPQSQTVNLDGIDKHIRFVYEPADPANTSAGTLTLTGDTTHGAIGETLQTQLRFDSLKRFTAGRALVYFNPATTEFVGAGTAYNIESTKVIAPGVLEVKFRNVISEGNYFMTPIHWKLKKRVTPSNTEFPVYAVLLSDQDALHQTDPVYLSGTYNLPALGKNIVGLTSNLYVTDFDGDGTKVAEHGRNDVTYQFTLRSLERDLDGYTITDTLPSYELADGTTAKAQFVPEKNPGWTLADGQLTYTSARQVNNTSSQLTQLKLRFPGAAYAKTIRNTARAQLTPANQGANEPQIRVADAASFAFIEDSKSGEMFTKRAIGPHMGLVGGQLVGQIFDTDNDRHRSVDWAININATGRDFGPLQVEDHDLDTRLKYTAITPDRYLIGGTLEIVDAGSQVEYSAPINSTEKMLLPDEVTSKPGVRLRVNTTKTIPQDAQCQFTVHTVLRDPDVEIFDEVDAAANILVNGATLYLDGQPTTTQADVKIMPAGKTFTATKTTVDEESSAVTGQRITYRVGSNIETDYGSAATNFELVDVLPPGLDLEQVQLAANFARLPGARYQIVSDFNGSGRTAVVFNADQVNDESDVYLVANLTTYISELVPDGRMINEIFVRAEGTNTQYGNKVTDPIAGTGDWSQAQHSVMVSASQEMFVRKQVRTPGSAWTSEITTAPGADFDYRLRAVNGTTDTRSTPVIYDLLPNPGDVTLYSGPRGSQFVNQLAGTPQLPAGWTVAYTCDTGMTQPDVDDDWVTWHDVPCAGGLTDVTAMRFNGPQLAPREAAEIVVPMKAGPVGSHRLSTEHLGQQAANHITYRDGQTIGWIESVPVTNRLESPPVDISFKKLGTNLVPLVGAMAKPLAGATFGLFDAAGVQQATAISGNDGMVHFRASARPGWVVRELSAPQGYRVADFAYTLTEDDLAADTINLPDVNNMHQWVPIDPITGTVEFTKVDKAGNPLPGVEFTLTPKPDASGKTVNIAPMVVHSNSAGAVKFYDVPAGTYELTENPAPRNLQPIDPMDVIISRRNERVQLGTVGQIVNDKGRVELLKLGTRNISRQGFGNWTPSDGVLKTGATFELWQGGTHVSTVSVTGTDRPNAMLENLVLDTVYTLKETVAPAGYDLNPTEYQFQITGNGQLADADGNLLAYQEALVIPNEQSKHTSSIAISKVDPNQPGTGVAGAVFDIARKQDDGSWLTTTTTTSNALGQAEFIDLTGGEYRVREIVAPHGYAPTNREYTFMVDDYNPKQFTWTARNYSTSIEVLKYEPLGSNLSPAAADKLIAENPGAIKRPAAQVGYWDVRIPLSGAHFNLLDPSGNLVTQVQTDATGSATITEKLDSQATYQLVETAAPSGYVKKANPIPVRIADYSLLTGFRGKIVLEVPNTKQYGRLTVSKMQAADGRPLAGAKFQLTDPNGDKQTKVTDQVGLAVFDRLEFGVDYKLQEIEAPAGFQIDPTVYTVRVTEDDPVRSLTIYDSAAKQSLTLNKVNQDNQALPGVEFELTGKFEPTDQVDQTVMLPLSNATGKISVNVIPGETYTLRETRTVDGYALLPETIKIRVSSAGRVEVVDGGVSTTRISGRNNLTIVNYLEGSMPMSGRSGVMPVLLLGTLLLLVGVPVVTRTGKKKGKNSNAHNI